MTHSSPNRRSFRPDTETLPVEAMTAQAQARAAYIRELVDTAPRFSQSQISALSTILGSGK